MIKSITVAALAITAFASAASAMTDTNALDRIQTFVPNADVQSLTDAEVASLLSVIHSGDTPSEVRGKIQAALN